MERDQLAGLQHLHLREVGVLWEELVIAEEHHRVVDHKDQSLQGAIVEAEELLLRRGQIQDHSGS